jgi:hypothetical protein
MFIGVWSLFLLKVPRYLTIFLINKLKDKKGAKQAFKRSLANLKGVGYLGTWVPVGYRLEVGYSMLVVTNFLINEVRK